MLGSINALQIISHMPMIDVLLTENVLFLYKLIQTVVQFDLFNPFDYISFGFSETPRLYDRFAECGYGS